MSKSFVFFNNLQYLKIMEKQFFRSQLFIGMLFSIILLGGCSTELFRSYSTLSPTQASNAALKYVKMAENADPERAIEYRLRAAELHIQAKEIGNAQRLLRNIQLDKSLSPSLQKLVLEARLSLIKNDFPKAQKLLNKALHEFSPETDNTLLGSDRRIALLLPSKGPHAEAAKTVRDGFLAAYYKKRQASDPSVKIYDTGDGGLIRDAYQKALSENATFIVGPLTKPEVQSLAGMKLNIPVLALNTITESTSTPSKLYQFGLMPEDEVIAVAEQALRQNKKRALILAPQTEWGQRLTDAFKQYWKAHGGQIVESGYYKSSQDVEAKIKSLLQVKDSQRRQDVDMIFLAASADAARQIKPLFNFYFAENLPVYATSSVYSGTPAAQKDQDLNGIHFCDMPWVFQHFSDKPQENTSSLEKLWPSSSRASRFFALGMDAYLLSMQLGGSQSMPPYGISGYTGDLSVNSYHRIQRGLTCAKFEQGIPVPD